MNIEIKYLVESFFDTEEEIESDILLKLPEFVDLGLPSGTKWCKCNIGADTETDYGDYFMWASTIPNNDDKCYWDDPNLPYQTANTTTRKLTKWSKYIGSTLSKYKEHSVNDEDALKRELDPEDDAAYVNTAGACRMPTIEQLEEIFKYTVNEFVKDFEGSGINGMIFKSKVNDNYIFIPAAGYRKEGTFYNQSFYGFIWSSSLNFSSYIPCMPYCACCMSFINSTIYSVDNSNRCLGFSVRGVLNK